jgi:hypothetical protein
MDAGAAITVIKKCICTKLTHLARTCPRALWIEPTPLSLRGYLREALSTILGGDLDEMLLSDSEKIDVEHRLTTMIRHGGVGFMDIERFMDAANVGCFVDSLDYLRDLDVDFKQTRTDEGRFWGTVSASQRIKAQWVEGSDDLEEKLQWVESGGRRKASPVQKFIENLAEGDFSNNATKGVGNSQEHLSNIVDLLQCASYTKNSFGEARIVKNTVKTTVIGGTEVDQHRLRDWIGSTDPLSGQWIDIVHLKACRMSSLELSRAMLTRLGVTIGRNNGFCPECRRKGVAGNGDYESFDRHAELCRNIDGGSNPSASCHADILKEIAGLKGSPLRTIPGARVKTGKIRISRYFPLKNKSTLSAEDVKSREGLESDIWFTSPADETKLIDICVTSVHAKCNDSVCGVAGACAALYEHQHKDPKHAKFVAEPEHLTGMGFDSRGGFSTNAIKVLRSLFSRNRRIAWRSDADRIWLQRRTIQVISAVIHKWAGIRRTALLVSQRTWARQG